MTRLTFDDAEELPDGWSADGTWIYFSTSGHDISSMADIYRVAAAGGTPMPVSADRYTSEYFAAPAPDGKTLAFAARGIGNRQWWRNGHSHLDQSEIWLLTDDGAGGAPAGGAARREVALADVERGRHRAVLHVRPRRHGEHLDRRRRRARRPRRARSPRSPTGACSGRPSRATAGRSPSSAASGSGSSTSASGRSAEVAIALRGTPAGPAVEHVSQTSQFQDLALSPDGKKVAFVSRGDVYAASAKDGGDAVRVSRTAANEQAPVWSADSRKLAYVSDRNGTADLVLYDFATDTESPLTTGPSADYLPRFSPDGKWLAYFRDQRELRVIDLAGKQDRVLYTGDVPEALDPGRSIVWSSDSKWIAFLATTGRQFSNVFVVPAAGGAARQVSFLANVFGGVDGVEPGRRRSCSSTRRSGPKPSQIARVDLVPRVPKFREDQFRDLFGDQGQKKPDAAGRRRRPRRRSRRRSRWTSSSRASASG